MHPKLVAILVTVLALACGLGAGCQLGRKSKPAEQPPEANATEVPVAAAPSAPSSAVVEPAPTRALGELVKTELYFGLSRPTGGEVGPAEWTDFLNKQVVPRFAQGFTAIDGYGWSRNKSGAVVSEPSRIVVLVYPDAPDRDAAIDAIRAAYRELFQQESVLRVTEKVGGSF